MEFFEYNLTIVSTFQPKTSDAADVALFSGLSSSKSSSKTNLIQTLSSFNNGTEQYRFCLREKLSDSLW